MALQALKHAARRHLRGDSLPDALVLLTRFVRHHRRLPKLLHPERLTDKILRRILFDRDRRLCIMADKYAVRDFVRERVGDGVLPDLLHVTTDPDTIPFDQLPDRFVVKPTHGANWVRVVRDKSSLDRAELIRTCKGWLAQNYHGVTREWAYKHVPPRIIVEELIDDGHGVTPHDYKLFTFHGRTEYILVVMGRFEDRGFAVMTPDWQPVDVVWPAVGKRRDAERPPHLSQMLEIAQKLGHDTPFARIDFYDTERKLYFGEMTMTPGGAFDIYEPREFDLTIGRHWRMRPRRGRAVTAA